MAFPLQIRELHVELTERCNAACPMCGRFQANGGPNPHLGGRELDLPGFRRIVPDAAVRRLKKLRLCGNFGDPAAARDLEPLARHLKAVNPRLKLRMNTNGGVRGPGFWTRLAARFTGPHDYVQFAIDGLEDTNALYRRGTSWRAIMANASAFIEAGGRAHWAFIAFRHNEHQVDAALELARSMGFRRFTLKTTKRFVKSGSLAPIASKPVLDGAGRALYELVPPATEAYRHPVLRPGAPDASTLARRAETGPIACRAAAAASAYLSAAGLVLPCCWLGAALYPSGAEASRGETAKLLEGCGGVAAVDGSALGLDAVVVGPFFQQVLPEAWARPGYAEGKPPTCARICGATRELFDGQFHHVELLP